MAKKPKVKGPRPEQRLYIEGMLATMTPLAIIVREAAKRFDVTEMTAKGWYTRTLLQLGDEAQQIEKDWRRAQMRAAFSDFYQKALIAKQFNSAITALDRLCKLDGLYAPEELTVANKQGVAERDPDKVRQRIKELAAKMPYLLQPTDEQLKTPGSDEPLQ